MSLSVNPLSFLEGGGEMGVRIRQFNWAATPLGAPIQWPQSLRTTISILLNAPVPMLLFWGHASYCFYNDAYLASLGSNDARHQALLGREPSVIWPELWNLVRPTVAQMLQGGVALQLDDQLLPLLRNGCMENTFWTNNYTPVIAESGRPGGVLCMCTETTAKQGRIDELMDSRELLSFAIEAAELGTWDLNPVTNRFTGNDRLKAWFGLQPQDEVSLDLALNAILPADRARVAAAIDAALQDAANGQYDTEYTIADAETGEQRTVRAKGRAWFGTDGKAYRLNGTLQDITAERKAMGQIKDAQTLADLALKTAGIGLFQISLETNEASHSPLYAAIMTGRATEELIDRETVIRHLHPEDRNWRDAAMAAAITTGAFSYEPRVIWEDGSVHRIHMQGATLFGEDGKPRAITGTVRDITQFEAQTFALQESERRFRALIEEAPVATCLFTGPEMIVEIINQPMIEAWGKDRSVQGKPLIEALPELKGQPFMDLLASVYLTGETYVAKDAPVDLVVNGVLGTYYYDFTYKPMFDETGAVTGIINVSINVTEKVIARQRLEESERKFRSLIEEAPVATCLFVGRDLRIEVANEQILAAWGKGRSVIGKPLMEAIPELEGQPFPAILDRIFDTGETHSEHSAAAELVVNGVLGTYYFDYTYKPMFDHQGKVYAIMDMAVDVTEQVVARQKQEEAEELLRGAVELAQLGTFSINAETGELYFSERLKEWFGLDPVGSTYINALPILDEQDRDRVRAAVAYAMTPESGGIYDEVYTITHPKTGRQRILHTQGKTIFNAAGKARRMTGTARDITREREQQLALEHEVQERTLELAAANEELQAMNEELEESNLQLHHSNDDLSQYAYVASHDLQEPLRKIRVFSDVLSRHKGLPAESLEVVQKIMQSAGRMTQLIRDLLEFSRLMKQDVMMKPVNLMEIVAAVRTDFELIIEEKSALLEVAELPVIEAVALQMNQLFYNLISNALKFTSPDRPPQIRIACTPLAEGEAAQHIPKPLRFSRYYRITVSDNGIGFDTQYAEQIFEVFKRLHGREHFAGSGIGLALCRRIVLNHNGVIYAVSSPGTGTTFHVILPDKQHLHQPGLPEGWTWEAAQQ